MPSQAMDTVSQLQIPPVLNTGTITLLEFDDVRNRDERSETVYQPGCPLEQDHRSPWLSLGGAP